MPYSIIKADLDRDKEQIIALWKRNFPDVPEERYEWIYKENPYGPPSSWLLKETTQNKIVGATTLFPRRLFLEKKPMIAGMGGDLIVDRNHRTIGPSLLLQKAAVSNSCGKTFAFIYGLLPTKPSTVVLKRVGYEIFANIFEMTKPLNSKYYLKKYIDIPIVTDILSVALNFMMNLMSKESYYINMKKYSYEMPTYFDNRFDELWEEASSNFYLIGERNSSFLNWRFKRSPIEYQIFSLVAESGKRVLGYLVFENLKRRTHIVDFLAPDIKEVFDSLFSGFIKYQKRIGIDSISISFAGNRVFFDKLRQFGFSLRSQEGKALLFSPSHFSISLEKIERENWYFTRADSDI